MKLWTIARICKALKVSEATIRRAIRSAGLEVHPVNGTPKIRNSVLVEWIGFDPGSDRVWTIAEVAKWSGYSVATIERSIRIGALESVMLCSRIRRIRNSQLTAWLGFDPATEDSYKPRPRQQPAEKPEPRLFEM